MSIMLSKVYRLNVTLLLVAILERFQLCTASGFQIVLHPNNTTNSSKGLFAEEDSSFVLTSDNEDQNATFSKSANQTSTDPSRLQRISFTLNETIDSLNTLVSTRLQNASRQSQQDFEKVGDLLRKVQAFLNQKGEVMPDSAGERLEREIKEIKQFIQDTQEQLEGPSRNLENSGQGTTFNSSDTRNGKTLSNFPSIQSLSSQVGNGLRSAFSEAENMFSNSLNQIQNQVQSLLSSVTNFFTPSSYGANANANDPFQQPPQRYGRLADRNGNSPAEDGKKPHPLLFRQLQSFTRK